MASLPRLVIPGALLPLAAFIACIHPASAIAETEEEYLSSAIISASELAQKYNIAYEKFTLENGLTVIVHEDRKAPLIAAAVTYQSGSKLELPGQRGYSYLTMQLMNNGSENAPEEFYSYAKKIRASNLNATNWLDQTNFFQTIPASALNSILFLESDRMGHMEKAITEKSLNRSIGITSIYIEQGNSNPYEIANQTAMKALFPEGHPYQNESLGSLADLRNANVQTMRDWHRRYFNPNNAVLVLAGDVNLAEAKPLVEKWFGDIPKGLKHEPAKLNLPKQASARKIILQGNVPLTRIYRYWVIPEAQNPNLMPLDIGASIIGGLKNSRLDTMLVQKQNNVISVNAYVTPFMHAGLFTLQIDVARGTDPESVSKKIDKIITDFVTNGPTADEVHRAAVRKISQQIDDLEKIGGFEGKAMVLAEGEFLAKDPGLRKRSLENLAKQTPEAVKTAVKEWLAQPGLEIVIMPKTR